MPDGKNRSPIFYGSSDAGNVPFSLCSSHLVICVSTWSESSSGIGETHGVLVVWVLTHSSDMSCRTFTPAIRTSSEKGWRKYALGQSEL